MRGPALMLAGIGLFGLLDANTKGLSATYPVWQVLLMRYAVILAGVLVARTLVPGWGGPVSTLRPRAHALRATAMVVSGISFFMAFRELPLAEGYLVSFTAPFLTLGLAAIALRERPPRAVWGWSVVGFGGVLLSVAPNLSMSGALQGYAFALLGALSYAVTFTVNRQLRHEGGVARVLLWPSLLGIIVLAGPGLAAWVPPEPLDLARMALNGLLVGGSTACFAAASRHADASRLAPLQYTSLIWGLVFDLLIWGAWPHTVTLAGGAIVIMACLMSGRSAAASVRRAAT